MNVQRLILDVDWGGTVNNNEDVPTWTPQNQSHQSTSHPDPTHLGHLERKPFRGALRALRLLKARGFQIGVVSKIPMVELVQIKVRGWFSHYGFDEVIPQDRICFCGERQDKVRLCLERGTTHFIDNRPDVLEPMVGRIPHLYLFRPHEQYRDTPLWQMVNKGEVTLVHSWREFADDILRKLEGK
jgi:hypothetical protein